MLDTNLLMNDIDLSQFEVCYICFTVLEELDKRQPPTTLKGSGL